MDIRTINAPEYPLLHRFLDRSFGMSPNWFQLHQPALARCDEEAIKWNLVAVKDGEILGHVGTYPLQLVSGPVSVTCGGIGNVSTKLETRGQGLMSKLLVEAIDRMVEQGQSISVLWGDRTRYGRFGWEGAGWALNIEVTRRSLGETEPVDLEEVIPTDERVAEQVATFYADLPRRVERSDRDMRLKLKHPGIRLFIGADGYVITRGLGSGNPNIIEISSPTGKEPELIMAVLNRTAGSSASIRYAYAPDQSVDRLISVAKGWNIVPMGMYRINDWPLFASQIAPVLTKRADGLKPFSIAVGCKWQGSTSVATFDWDGRHLDVKEGRGSERYVQMETRRLTRHVFGAPAGIETELGPLGRLLPIPFFIHELDKV